MNRHVARALVIGASAATMALGAAGPAAAAPGNGAVLFDCFDTTGKFVFAPSGNINFTCNQYPPSGDGALVVKCFDVFGTEYAGRTVFNPTGHLHSNCQFPS